VWEWGRIRAGVRSSTVGTSREPAPWLRPTRLLGVSRAEVMGRFAGRKPQYPSVLVTDGEERATLAVVRSLGRAGYHVFVCSPRRNPLAGASRYCRGCATVPHPLDEPDSFSAAVERLLQQWGIVILLPITEASILALLPVRERFGGVTVPLPPLDCFRRVCDKAHVLSEASDIGIAVPNERRLMSPAERRYLAPAELDFPLVIKPVRSVACFNSRRVKVGVRHAADWEALQVQLDRVSAAAYPLLLQRRVIGPGIGVFLLIWDGELRALFAHRRIREKPPSGGVSVLRESIPADVTLVKRSQALLNRLGWQGMAMVEYKLEAATGKAFLMEVNGRFWGSLQLAIDAGVDFPVLLVSSALGRASPPVLSYHFGVRSRWWWGDVDHLIARLTRSPEDLSLPPGGPGNWRAMLDFVTSHGPSSRGEIFRLDDPSPAVRETIDWVLGR